MKVKHIAFTRLSNNIGFSLAFIVLVNKFLSVQTASAYISGIALSNSERNANENLVNQCSNKTGNESSVSATNRTGKFLFDTLFNINTPLADEDFDDDDDDEVKTCNCGEYARSIGWRLVVGLRETSVREMNAPT